MIRLLVLCLMVVGCGTSGGGSAPAPGPFADIAGTYATTCTSSTGYYAGVVSPGTTGTVTITDQGVATTSGGAVYQMNRGGANFFTNSRDLSATEFEQGQAPFSMTTFTLNAFLRPATTPDGSATFSTVKSFAFSG